MKNSIDDAFELLDFSMSNDDDDHLFENFIDNHKICFEIRVLEFGC